jgi:CRISPR-associated protein Cas5t
LLRLIIYQETAHFRIATIGNPYLSYLLPPPSTVYGFLRKITNYERVNYSNTHLSIQGFHKGVSIEKERLILETKKEIKTNIISIQKLHEVQWVIHIKSNEDLEKKIENSITEYKGILRFGRTEDLIIDFCLDKVEEKGNVLAKEDNALRNNIYLPWISGEKFKGQLFSMFLDSEVDENLRIVGYIPIQLIYCSIYSAKDKLKITDGEYYISWIT